MNKGHVSQVFIPFVIFGIFRGMQFLNIYVTEYFTQNGNSAKPSSSKNVATNLRKNVSKSFRFISLPFQRFRLFFQLITWLLFSFSKSFTTCGFNTFQILFPTSVRNKFKKSNGVILHPIFLDIFWCHITKWNWIGVIWPYFLAIIIVLNEIMLFTLLVLRIMELCIKWCRECNLISF